MSAKTLNYTSITNNNNNFGPQKCEKDCEIDRLKQMIEDLAKSNDEREKKIYIQKKINKINFKIIKKKGKCLKLLNLNNLQQV